MNHHTNWLDQSSAIRRGEELQAEPLTTFLNNHFGVVSDLEISQFPSGYSNLTYLIRHNSRDYVLRRPPIGAQVKSGHDMKREYDILSALYPLYRKVPKPILYSNDFTILGAPFYLMERVSGVILRGQMPKAMQPNPELMAGISNSFVDTFVELHAIDVNTIGLGDFGKPLGYEKRQVEGWTRRYLNAKTDDIPKLEYISKWLFEHLPVSSSKIALIHNDFKYDNFVLDPHDWTKVRAVLDWEMTTIGNPLMDLGTSLGYWINPDDPDFMKTLNLSPTTVKGNLSREQLVHQYALKSGNDVEDIIFYYVYGLFKLSGVAQQIYFRYKKGLTHDSRFEKLIDGVKLLSEIAHQALTKQRLDRLF
jgi:aminoglycoside phosphotransferase (APT) family kinase protein